MIEYKLKPYHKRHSNGTGHITKDGHTMFNEDIVRDLECLQARVEELTEFAKSMTRRVSHGDFDSQFKVWKELQEVDK